MLFFPTRSSFNSFLTRLSLIAGDLGDHSESEDDEEGEAEKTRWEEIFFSLFYHFTSGAREIFYHFLLSFLFQVEGGAGRGEAGQDGAGDDPPGQPCPPPGLALGLVRLGPRSGRQCGPG